MNEAKPDVDLPVEPPQVHPRTGHRSIDLIVPIAALFVSFLSILIAWRSSAVEQEMARQNERMVQASSFPHVSLSNRTLSRTNGLDRVTLSITNDGVGPAEVRSTELIVHGAPVGNAIDFMKRYGIPGGRLNIARTTNVMLRPGQELAYFDLDANPSIAAGVQRMVDDIQNHKITVRLCYASVFGETWTVDGPNTRPKPVAQCPPVRTPYE